LFPFRDDGMPLPPRTIEHGALKAADVWDFETPTLHDKPATTQLFARPTLP